MKRFNRTTALGLLGALALGQAAMHSGAVFPRWKKDFSPSKSGSGLIDQGLSPD